MHFQIYIPGSSLGSPGSVQSPPESLALVGLADLAANASVQPVTSGPKIDGVDLGPGKVFTWDLKSSSYFGENADWIPAVPSGDLPEKRYWVGIHKNSRPTPEELRKPSIIHPSLPVSTAGSDWLIPVARNLPRVFRLNPQGELTSEVCEKHQRYWQSSYSFYDFVFGTGETSVPYRDLWEFAVLALSQNYRVTREVVSELEVCTTESFTEIVRAACDVEAIVKEMQEGQKKTVPES